MKWSKFNRMVKDKDGNLVIFNFFKGFSSLTKVMSSDINTFKSFFESEITATDVEDSGYEEFVKILLEKGILIDSSINEDILYEKKIYEEIFDDKMRLIVLTTGKCNFNCSYCLEAEQTMCRDRLTSENQAIIIDFLQKYISKCNSLEVAWFGGEPLLEKSIICDMSDKMIKICKARHIPYSARITTNGFLLDIDTFDALYNRKVYDYMITLDGFKEQHDKYRHLHNGDGTYDVILKNLLNIRDNKKYKFAKIVIRVNISRDVLDILDDFAKYLVSLFSEDSRFAFHFIPVENYSKNKTEDNQYVGIYEWNEKIRKDDFLRELYFAENKDFAALVPIGKCTSGKRNKFVITPDLKVYKCEAHYDFNDNYLGYIDSKGNMIIDENLHEKWYLSNEILMSRMDQCKDCFYKTVCSNNCRNCPYCFVKENNEYGGCPLESEDFIKNLEKQVIQAAELFPCYIVKMDDSEKNRV